MSSLIQQATAFEDGGIVLMARVLGWSGTAINQASVTSIALKVFEYATEREAIANTNGTEITGVGGSLTVSDVVYDALQTAAPWTKDSTGYNVRYDAPATCLPNGGKWYRFEFKVTPASGAAYWLVWVVEAVSVASS